MSLPRILLRNLGWLLTFTIAINLALFAAPLHMLLVYDRVLTSGSVETLVMLTVICVVLLLGMSLLTTARQWLLIGKAEELDRTFAPKLFHNSTARGGKGEAASATLADLAATRQLVNGPAASALLDLPFTPLFFGGLFVIHWYFGVLAIVGAAVIVATAIIGDLATRASSRRADAIGASARQIIGSYEASSAAVVAMGMQDRLAALWGHLHFASSASQSAAAAHSSLVSSLVKFLRMALQSVALALGAWLVLHKEGSPGVIIASSIIMGRALAPLEIIIGGWRPLVAGLKAARRLGRTVEAMRNEDASESPTTRLPAPRGVLKVSNVGHWFIDQQHPVLTDISLEVAPGEILAIVGETGSGKSALARLLVGLERPAQGSVTLDGVTLASWPSRDVGAHIGYVPQDTSLLEGSVGENISRYALNVAGEHRDAVNKAIIAAASACGAHAAIAALPKAYDTAVGAGGCLLAMGLRRRVALARAVFGDVRLVVLDDPTSGLDAAGERAVAALLTQLKTRGVTVVLITHNAALVQIADKIAIFQEGRIAQQGTPNQLFNVPRMVPNAPPAHPQTVVHPQPVARPAPPVATPPSGTVAGARQAGPIPGPAAVPVATPTPHIVASAAASPPVAAAPASPEARPVDGRASDIVRRFRAIRDQRLAATELNPGALP